MWFYRDSLLDLASHSRRGHTGSFCCILLRVNCRNNVQNLIIAAAMSSAQSGYPVSCIPLRPPSGYDVQTEIKSRLRVSYFVGHCTNTPLVVFVPVEYGNCTPNLTLANAFAVTTCYTSSICSVNNVEFTTSFGSARL